MIPALETLVAESLPSTDYFVLSLDQDELGMIRLVVDHPDGISIDQIVSISRAINRSIHEQYGEDIDFQLEVMSPGADMPLTDLRQFNRHIGRTLEITPTEGKAYTAELLEVQEGLFRVVEKRLPSKQQPKVKLGEERLLSLADQSAVKVVLEFK